MADHYLMKLILAPHLADPVKEAPDVHKHFTRYSKGSFDGPVIKVSKTKAKISVWASHEYEDLLLRFALKNCQDEKVKVTGNIIGGINFAPLLKKLDFPESWNPVKSKGQTKNYTTEFKTAVEIETSKLLDLATKGTPYVYILLSFTSADKSIVLKIKKKPPRPSSKNPEDSSATSKLKFASLKLPNSPKLLDGLLEEIAGDFRDEIPSSWKSLILQNTYEITELELPKNKKLSSRLIRLHTLRKGILNRVIEIDGEPFKNSVAFTA
ncbi:MAG: hypothetical protein DRO88_06730 [Promethearchaeia archaeon]|nr:MAG: hypothetical protein DRO88_06730 [Candidatus Lokiarchaeia archaeon]